jgi:hypothetical protein
MYQKACFLLGAALSVAVASAQPKYDCYWMMGYDDHAPPDQIWGASAMDFCGDSLHIYEINRPMDFDYANASMADAEGNLLFYTNGFDIANAQHGIMLNGAALATPGTTGHGPNGIPIPQSVIILPWPENPGKFFVFYGRISTFNYIIDDQNRFIACNTPLHYSVVDMNLEGGAGAVIEKDAILSNDTTSMGKLTAARHANGRDWWLVVPKLHSQKILRFLITPEGVIDYGPVDSGMLIRYGNGYAVFSPDGAYYASISIHDWSDYDIDFFAFDRCAGAFSPLGKFQYDDPGEILAGLAISPNSRYLYHTSLFEIRQFDLWAEDIVGSLDTVAVYDGYLEDIPGFIGLPPLFVLPQLAPDGKIYIISGNTVRSMHVIEQPDLPGSACEVRQRGIVLPKLNWTIPNFPHYRLGALEGSPCDTIVAVSTGEQRRGGDGWQLRVLPNPAQDFCVLVLDPLAGDALPALENLSLRLYDGMGRLLRRQALPAGLREHRIGLEGLPPGMYYVSLQAGGQPAKTEKLIVLR